MYGINIYRAVARDVTTLTCACMAKDVRKELKTVVRETFTVLGTLTVKCPRGGDVCNMLQLRRVQRKKQKMTVHHFGFTEKVHELPYTVRTLLLWKCHHRNAIVGMSFFMGWYFISLLYQYIVQMKHAVPSVHRECYCTLWYDATQRALYMQTAERSETVTLPLIYHWF